MRWYEYKMEVDELHAPEDLKARLLAMQAGAAPEAPAARPAQPKKKGKAIRFPMRRLAGFAACFAVGAACCGVVLGGGLRVGLGSAGAGKASQAAAYASTNNYATFASPESAGVSMDTAANETTLQSRSGVDAAQQQTKIIYTASLTLETKDYDETRAALEAALAEAGGYMEACDESTYSESARSLNLRLRVPEENYEAFLAAAAETGNLVSRSEQAEDVTAQYMDVAARLENLESQRARLLELQAGAETVADLLEIESSLSDVQYQLESWQRQLDWYDDQVESCTVNVYLNEVKTYTPSEEGFGQRLTGAFGRGWDAFVEGVQNLVVFLAGAWPVVLILAGAAGGFFGWRRIRNKKMGR